MKFICGLLFGLILGFAAYWYIETHPHEHSVASQTPAEKAGNASDSFKTRLDALDLRTDEIKSDLARDGRIVRRKAQDLGAKVADAASDARIVAAIKAKYAVDPDLSVWDISVSCSDGHVTLSGTVPTADDIGKAMALAMEPDGVRDVISTLRPKST